MLCFSRSLALPGLPTACRSPLLLNPLNKTSLPFPSTDPRQIPRHPTAYSKLPSRARILLPARGTQARLGQVPGESAQRHARGSEQRDASRDSLCAPQTRGFPGPLPVPLPRRGRSVAFFGPGRSGCGPGGHRTAGLAAVICALCSGSAQLTRFPCEPGAPALGNSSRSGQPASASIPLSETLSCARGASARGGGPCLSSTCGPGSSLWWPPRRWPPPSTTRGCSSW